jgi:hypothetical protein
LALFGVHLAGKAFQASSEVLKTDTLPLLEVEVEVGVTEYFESFVDGLVDQFEKLEQIGVVSVLDNFVGLLLCLVLSWVSLDKE